VNAKPQGGRRPGVLVARLAHIAAGRGAHIAAALAATLILIGAGAGPAAAQEEPMVPAGYGAEGRWEGSISILGQELGIIVTFERAAGADGGSDGWAARIDIPQQAALGLPLQDVSFDAPRVHFELAAGAGLAVWDGALEEDAIEGEFTQAGVVGTFRMTRAAGAAEPEATSDPTAASETDVAGEAIPAEPTRIPSPSEIEREPVLYRDHAVVLENGDITLSGTLSLPVAEGPHPAVVLITGSGPQNRDEEIFGFQPFRLIADHFARVGIAVLRMDDRGVDGSTGSVSESTSADFAGDALVAVDYLTNHPAIDASSIGLLGHSEGGIVAPMAADRSDDISFLVLLAGTAVTGSEVLLEQGELIARANGASPEAVEQQKASQRRLFGLLRSNASDEELSAELDRTIREGVESMPPERREAIRDLDQFVATQVAPQLASMTSTWFRAFLDYDPAEALRTTSVPVLALFGELDLQVPPAQNREPMARALAEAGNTDVTIEVIPGANHLFQVAITGNPREYLTLEKEFVPGLLDRISSWIQARTRPRTR
jgi:pimeloyl-ACP methyl ester carboxylesterase